MLDHRAIRSEHGPEAVPPKPHRFMAGVDPPFVQQVFDVSKRKGEPDVHHHRQADDLGRGLEITEGAGFCHFVSLSDHHARHKKTSPTKPALVIITCLAASGFPQPGAHLQVLQSQLASQDCLAAGHQSRSDATLRALPKPGRNVIAPKSGQRIGQNVVSRLGANRSMTTCHDDNILLVIDAIGHWG